MDDRDGWRKRVGGCVLSVLLDDDDDDDDDDLIRLHFFLCYYKVELI